MPVTKPSGWKGRKGDNYWHKDTTYGVKSMCSDCGKESSGYGSDDDRFSHTNACPRIQGPRREWRTWVASDGSVCTERSRFARDIYHETREAALRALDADLAAQIETLNARRMQVLKLLSEAES